METLICVDCKTPFTIHDPIQRTAFRCCCCQAQYRINMTDKDRKDIENARRYNAKSNESQR